MAAVGLSLNECAMLISQGWVLGKLVSHTIEQAGGGGAAGATEASLHVTCHVAPLPLARFSRFCCPGCVTTKPDRPPWHHPKGTSIYNMCVRVCVYMLSILFQLTLVWSN